MPVNSVNIVRMFFNCLFSYIFPQILGDKERLIKRTQLKRSVYKVLGKTAVDDKQDVTSEETVSTVGLYC